MIERLHRAVWRTDHIRVFRSDGNALPRHVSGLTIRDVATLDEWWRPESALMQYRDDYFDRRHLARCRERLAIGYRAHIAYLNGRLAHVCWSHRDDVLAATETGRCRLVLPRPATIITDCWTPPELRGRGVYPAVLSRLATRAGGAWIYCEAANVASAAGILKAGFIEEAAFSCRRLLRRFTLAHHVKMCEHCEAALPSKAALWGLP